jgi:fructose-1,6-bisphosphatase II
MATTEKNVAPAAARLTSMTQDTILEGACMCNDLIDVVERSAIASARWLGRGDNNAADQAAVDALRSALNELPIHGTVVIGEGQKDEAPELYVGEELGTGGREVHIAVDPLEGTNLTAKGLPGAISVLAVASPGGLFPAPDIYMDKLSVGAVAAGTIDIEAPVKDNLKAIARAYDIKLGEVTVTVLERDRHKELIKDIRDAGARIKLIPDGDITSAIAAGVAGTGDHVTIGKGGATEGVIAAAAMKALGGEIQAKMWPTSQKQVEMCRDRGISDVARKLATDDLVQGNVIFAAAGVTSGSLLNGVTYFHQGARTNAVIMCTRCNVVRFVDTIHLFSKDIHKEIRL